VTQVFKGDPAEKAGIQPNDIIIAIDGQSVTTGRDLSSIIANTPVGKKTRITLLRNGEKREVKATVAKRNDDETLMVDNKEADDGNLGIQVADLSPARAQQFGLDADESGVLVVDVANGSRAQRAGVRVGDIIKGINRKKIKQMADYEKIIKKMDNKESVLMLIMRRNEGLKAIKILP
jgi:serine protease Do